MENASKALLMAGGLFLALLILSTMMYMSSSISGIAKAQDDKKAAEQLAAFNAQYEAYNKKLMYGTDIVTVVNKAKEDEIKIEIVDDSTTYSSTHDLTNYINSLKSNLKGLTTGESSYEGLKIFECTDVGYDENTGKINYMKFNRKTN